MKIFKNIKKIIMCTFAVLSLISCTQELDINVNPNVPADAPLKNLLPTPQVNLAYSLGGNVNRLSGSVIQHYAGHRAQPLDYARYNITSAASDNLWTNMYNTGYDLKNIESKSKISGDRIYLGISQILTAYVFSITTDLYGDIPYSEALKGALNITPKYDKQEEIYRKLISLIDEGISNVKSNQGLKPTTDDLIYGGNIVKWERLANSLKLRLYNHLSKRDSNAALNFLNTNPLLIATAADDAKLIFGTTAANANPIHQFDVLSGRKDNAVSSTIVDKMKALNDPRIPLYFKPVVNAPNAGQVIGNVPGNDTDDSGESRYSRVGSAFASIGSPVYLMSAAEVNFIKSEIYFRNNDLVNAKTSYESAITQDFTSLGIATAAPAYISSVGVLFDNTLERIIGQKWITMFQAPHEAWVDWRRTGFPTLIAPPITLTDRVIPRRLPYPQIEINVNRNSLQQGPGIPVPYVTLLTKVWWEN